MRRLRDILTGETRHQEEILPADSLDVLDPAEDEDLFSLMAELEELGQVQPSSAARSRGWIAVRTEVRAREAWGAFAPAGRRLRGTLRGRRLALGSAAALLALGLGIVAVLHAGTPGPGPGVVDTSITTATTALADNTTATQEPSSNTGATSPRTTTPTTPGSTAPASSSTSASSVTSVPLTTGSTAPRLTTTTRPQTVTTLPPSSTTSEQLMASEERERSAKTASGILAQAVLNGNTDAATSVLASSATRGLMQMKAALVAPSSYAILSVEDTGPSFARVLVEFSDTPTSGDTVARRFLFEVRVDRNGALVIGIYEPPAE